MKVAITADLHLRRKDETPDRYDALVSIINECIERSIGTLIIAGDLFDRDFSSYSDFDSLCKEYPQLRFLIIPGNHDHQIERRFFCSANIEVVKVSKLIDFEGVEALLIPYSFDSSLDEALVDFFEKNRKPDKWILIGHGDYITKLRDLDLYESGLYMPLTKSAIVRESPMRVFLGHIHKPSNFGRVLYPGSPCGLDITETGRRRFIVYDTKSDTFEEIYLSSQRIFQIESLLITPFDDDEEALRRKIDGTIKNWALSISELERVTLRLTLKGFTEDLKRTEERVREIFESYGVSIYGDEIDTSGLKPLKKAEPERLFLLERVLKTIEEIDLSRFLANREKIIEKTVELIFQ